MTEKDDLKLANIIQIQLKSATGYRQGSSVVDRCPMGIIVYDHTQLFPLLFRDQVLIFGATPIKVWSQRLILVLGFLNFMFFPGFSSLQYCILRLLYTSQIPLLKIN